MKKGFNDSQVAGRYVHCEKVKDCQYCHDYIRQDVLEENYVRWHGGRRLSENTSMTFDWPGVSFSVKVKSDITSVILEMNGNGNYFNVKCNRAVIGFLRTVHGVRCYRIPLPPDYRGIVTIVKRTEAKAQSRIRTSGHVTLYAIYTKFKLEQFDSDTLSSRRVIFYGDSDTAAFGVLGSFTHRMNFISGLKKRNEDIEKSWAVLASNRFNADYNIQAISGIGVQDNAPCIFTFRQSLPSLFDRVVASRADPVVVPYDASDDEVVVVFIGGNDFISISMDKQFRCNYKQRVERLRVKFVQFLQAIRMVHRSGYLIVFANGPNTTACCGSKNEQQLYHDIVSIDVTKRAVEELEDDKVVYQELNCPRIDFDNNECWAGMGHWSALSHQLVSESVVQSIERVVGWQQTFVDVSVNQDETSLRTST